MVLFAGVPHALEKRAQMKRQILYFDAKLMRTVTSKTLTLMRTTFSEAKAL